MKFDDENKVARVTLRATDLLPILNQKEIDDPKGSYALKLAVGLRAINFNCKLSFTRCEIPVASRIWSIHD